MRPCPRAGSAAFTISELLLTLTVLAILMALLMPVLGMIRQAAASTKCLSNLRQYQMANSTYAQDWKGCYVPVSYTSPTPSGWSDPWYSNVDLIDRLRSDPALHGAAAAGSSLARGELCPLAVKRSGQVTSAVAYSYGLNQQCALPLRAANGETAAVPHVWMDGIGGKIAFADGLDWALTLGGANQATYWSNGTPAPEGSISFKTTAYRHRNRANAVYYDGHAVAHTWSDLYVSPLWK
jgi:prepilin-type processing-associated H-X9-DG protein